MARREGRGFRAGGRMGGDFGGTGAGIRRDGGLVQPGRTKPSDEPHAQRESRKDRPKRRGRGCKTATSESRQTTPCHDEKLRAWRKSARTARRRGILVRDPSDGPTRLRAKRYGAQVSSGSAAVDGLVNRTRQRAPRDIRSRRRSDNLFTMSNNGRSTRSLIRPAGKSNIGTLSRTVKRAEGNYSGSPALRRPSSRVSRTADFGMVNRR